MKLNLIDELPPELLEIGPDELDSFFPGPTLLKISGKKNPPLFVSTLLHGDEPTGYLALQKLFRELQESNSILPRSLLVFLGNMPAAARNIRHLPGQPDYNRIWMEGDLPEHEMTRQVLSTVRREKVLAAVDIHNTSGKNPHYACINKLNGSIINLGRLFSRTLVYFTRPEGVLSTALSEFCPAVTIESGQPGDLSGVSHVLKFLRQCLELDDLDDGLSETGAPDIFHSIARILVPEHCRIGFDRECRDVDFCFLQNLDTMNFSELPENTLLGWRFNRNLNLQVMDENGEDVAENFLSYEDEEIRLRRSVVPSLFTTNPRSVYQDCLGYLMQRYALP